MTRRHKGCRGVHGHGSSRCNRSCIDLHKCYAAERERGSHSRNRTYRLALFHHRDMRRTRTVHKSSGRVSMHELAMAHVRRKCCSHDRIHHRHEQERTESETSSLNTVGVGSGADAGVGVGVGVGVGAGIVVGVGASEMSRASRL